jgi:hypothetical protein
VRRIRKAAALAGSLAIAVAAGPSSAPGAGRVISDLQYQPPSLSDVREVLTVTFRANRAARRGREFAVVFTSLNEAAPRPCAWIGYSWNRAYGGDPTRRALSAGRHRLVIHGTYFGASAPFCVGRAAIEVVEHKLGTDMAKNLGRGSSVRVLVRHA